MPAAAAAFWSIRLPRCTDMACANEGAKAFCSSSAAKGEPGMKGDGDESDSRLMVAKPSDDGAGKPVVVAISWLVFRRKYCCWSWTSSIELSSLTRLLEPIRAVDPRGDNTSADKSSASPSASIFMAERCCCCCCCVDCPAPKSISSMPL